MGRGSKQTSHEAILATTRKLFADSGYNNVSMRDIAASLGISVGNLTYYYKNKKQLIEAAVIDKHKRTKMLSAARTLEELDKMLMSSQRLQEEHLYYFRHYSQLSVISDAVIAVQKQVYHDGEQVWLETFTNLCQAGILLPELYPGQFKALTATILFLSAYWYEQDYLNRQTGRKTPDFRASVWGLVLPLLTEKGKQLYLHREGNENDRIL